MTLLRLVCLVAVILCIANATACNDAPPKTPAELGALIKHDAKASYPVLVEVNNWAKDLTKAWEAVSPPDTEDERALLADVVDRLNETEALLVQAKPWVETGENEAEGKKALASAATRLAMLVDTFGARGVKPPKPLKDALDVAVAALGEAEPVEPADAGAPAPNSSAQ